MKTDEHEKIQREKTGKFERRQVKKGREEEAKCVGSSASLLPTVHIVIYMLCVVCVQSYVCPMTATSQTAALLWQLKIPRQLNPCMMHEKKPVNAVSNKHKDQFNMCHHSTAGVLVNMHDF